MSKKNILIVDDEKMMHVVFRAMLGQQFNLYFAKSAQEGIDTLSEQTINLVLLDIQMPEVSGIELLESIMIDTTLRYVPVIIMTGKATEELEKKARELGAVAFFKKHNFLSQKKETEKIIRKNLSEHVNTVATTPDYKEGFREIIKSLINERVSGDFIKGARKFGVGMMNSFDVDYFSLWTVSGDKTNLIVSLGDNQPEDFGPEELLSEEAFKNFITEKEPYLTNNPTSDQRGIFADTSIKMGLSSEIGIPLFAITKDDLINNNMKVPPEAAVFGFIILKRNRVFSTKEFTILSKFVIQSGTILYGLYQQLFSS
jgi:CheY-like chemotaxis protein